jgi:hypothetical protein
MYYYIIVLKMKEIEWKGVGKEEPVFMMKRSADVSPPFEQTRRFPVTFLGGLPGSRTSGGSVFCLPPQALIFANAACFRDSAESNLITRRNAATPVISTSLRQHDRIVRRLCDGPKASFLPLS